MNASITHLANIIDAVIDLSPTAPTKVRELGYDWIELSPRQDFLEWFKAPRVFPERVKSFKRALKASEVKIASLLPMYRWASNDEAERQAAVRHWKRAIEICIEMEVDTMNSEFGRGPHPDKGSCYCCHTGSMIEACEDAWWRSMEELVPIFEKEGINLHIEPHPEDWCETLQPAVDIIRTVDSPRVKFLYCAPHTFYFGDDTRAMLRDLPGIIAAVGPTRIGQLSTIAAMEKHHPPEPPHWYLFFLGVAPHLRGQGVGSAILEATLKRVDDDRRPAYLDNSNPKNTRLYERAGFRVVSEYRARKDAPPIWGMWRDART